MKSLEEIFTSCGILIDSNDDGYADGIQGYILINRNASILQKKLAVNLSARIGYESTALDFPVVKFLDDTIQDESINIRIKKDMCNCENDSQCCIKLVKENNKEYVDITSASDLQLEYGGKYICERLPYVWKVKEGALKLSDVLNFIKTKLSCDAYIREIFLDYNFCGISRLIVELQAEDKTSLSDRLRVNSDFFKWDYIKETNFKISDGSEELKVYNEKPQEKQLINSEIDIIEEKANTFDLTEILSTKGILRDTDNDFLPDKLVSKIIIPDDCNDEELIAASNVAAKLGLEILGIEFPVVYSVSEYSTSFANPILIGRAAQELNVVDTFSPGLIKTVNINNNHFIIISDENASSFFAEELNCEYYDTNNELIRIKDKLKQIIESKGFQGQLARVVTKLLNENSHNVDALSCYLDNSFGFNKELFESFLKNELSIENFKLGSYTETKTIFSSRFDIPWEVDEFKKLLETKVYPYVKSDDKIVITGFLSEELEIRNSLSTEVTRILKENGCENLELNIFSAYKQGISFITDYLIPRVKKLVELDKISDVIIRFKPFLKNGMKSWEDVDGAVPNLASHLKSDEDKWFDLPIRWIQELYPADDIISKELGLERDNIHFQLGSVEDEFTYEFIFMDNSHKVLFKEGFNAKYSERLYLDAYPSIGKVHPSTGWIKVEVNDKVLVDENIKTDLERVWDVYQKDVLKSCSDFIRKKTNNNPGIDKQPFFKELELKINLSEPDYKLNVREDMISSLDALHEDIYFAGLDFFKTFGEREFNVTLQEPGLILPYINKVNGQAPYMEVKLLDTVFEKPTFVISKEIYEIREEKDITYSINLNSVILNKTNKEIDFDINVDEGFQKLHEQLKAYALLLKNKIFLSEFSDIIKINIYNKNKKIDTLQIEGNPNTSLKLQDLNIDEIDIPQDKVIGYEDYIKIIEQLKRVKGFKVWKAATSYQGRDIYAVDVICPTKSKVVSLTKLINLKPTYLLNNRHHANEVSSTNSSFYLLKKLLSKSEEDYLKKVNVTIIPFENVDGGYIHYELQKDNPNWKLHIARFNCVGKEFARDYWIDSKYTESRALPSVWRKWLPDFVVDNHGVPTHEWDQQFSGYVSPWFKGFWLPRALFYGYFWYVDSPDYPRHKYLNECIQEKVAEDINRDEEISNWNKDWKDRFEKYAHSFMPKLFPANYYENLIFYWIPYKPDKNAWHVSHRFPWITAVDWTTEVSDETAQEDYLRLCAKTHYIADISIIDMLSKAQLNMRNLSFQENEKITLKLVRQRPINIDNSFMKK